MTPSATLEPAPVPAPVRRVGRGTGLLLFVWLLVAGGVVTVLCATAGVLAAPVSRRFVKRIPLVWSRLLLRLTGVTVETSFDAPLPDGPVVFVSNHQGLFDIPALFVGLGEARPFVYVAKKQVFSYPFVGWFLRAAGYVGVDRGNHAEALRSLEAAGERIRSGTSVMVFAEGTRSADGSILPFKKGAFHVALKAGVPIVPVALEGSLQVHPKRRWYLCPNTVRVLVGSPHRLDGRVDADREALVREVRSHVIALHRRLGGLGGDLSDAVAVNGIEALRQADRPGRVSP
jgi:1-acyl-sn-glycerol-3-phosphate acyltransferase